MQRCCAPLLALAFLSGCAMRGNSAPEPKGAAFAALRGNIDRYMQIRGRVAAQVPGLPDKAEPEAIVARQQGLAKGLAQARPNAKAGEIFTPEVQARLTEVIRSEIRGPAGRSAFKSITDDNPVKKGEPSTVKLLTINGPYPDKAPLSTVPPSLLLRLPTLPAGLEYRFVGRDLILRDADANIVIDFLTRVIP